MRADAGLVGGQPARPVGSLGTGQCRIRRAGYFQRPPQQAGVHRDFLAGGGQSAQPHQGIAQRVPDARRDVPPPTMTNLDTAAIRRKPVLNGLINAQAA
ncbi:MAG TPA: hypothetical protein VFQ68_26955 [Streptosporangiaceae bacterium]|nr:hypothetical protein [Streptosporangiaceae bacterium]